MKINTRSQLHKTFYGLMYLQEANTSKKFTVQKIDSNNEFQIGII